MPHIDIKALSKRQECLVVCEDCLKRHQQSLYAKADKQMEKKLIDNLLELYKSSPFLDKNSQTYLTIVELAKEVNNGN